MLVDCLVRITMRSLVRLISAMTKIERIALGVLAGVLVFSFAMLLRLFYIQNTTNIAVRGGTYIEGSVGEILPINPWFVTGNDVNRDIVTLMFSGLMKYDPVSGTVIDDLATVNISSDNRIYTATLKPDLQWHDSTKENPHPVTADDVIFTFKTIQNPEFPNPILKQNFHGIDIEKIDERTVRFRLSKPYSFFGSNLTLGLVPAASFEGIPVGKLNQALDFGFHPIGAGPYSFLSLLQTDLSSEITMKRFERTVMPEYKIDRIVLRVFSDYSALLTDITNLNGVRLSPRNEKGFPILPRHFRPMSYTLPQYVGMFFNLDRPIPSDHGIRLGLQLATNKQEIADAVHETQVIDTPLMEIDTGDWRYRFDSAAAKGAFFESSWNVPEKIRLQRLLEQRETNAIGPLSSLPRIALLGTGGILTLTGSTANLKMPLSVNGIRVQTGSKLSDGTMQALSGSWIVRLPAGGGGSGSLHLGNNLVQLTDGKDDIVDTAYLERITDARIFGRSSEEQLLVEKFLQSKKLPENDPATITVQNMTLENGYLRRRRPDDPVHTRINEKGKGLSLTILTSSVPASYGVVASVLKKQWENVGVEVTIDIPDSKKEFEEKLLRRKYDILLFGQALFDNLDSYPYWHSSQIQDRSGDMQKMKLDAFNLSQYTSFEVDAELVRIRETNNATSRNNALKELNERLKKDIPAIVLYSPLYIYGGDQSIHGMQKGKFALHADRFSMADQWYVATKRQFLQGKNWLSFPGWFFGLVLWR